MDARCVTFGGVSALITGDGLDPTKPVVVIDEGGPGLDPLAQAGQGLFSGLSNSLIVIEPWVRTPPRADCRTALDRYVSAVRGPASRRLGGAAREFATECASDLDRESRFASSGLKDLADGLRARGVPRLIFTGISFGAERVARAAGPVDDVVLVAPYVATTSLTRELALRTRRGERALHLTRADRLLLRRVDSRLPIRLAQRSVPFTRIDLDAAVVASAYDPRAAAPRLRHDLRAMADGASVTAPWLSKAADYLEGRYGTNDYYAGLIGYFGNFCAVHRTGSASDSDSFLARFHRVCSVLGGTSIATAPSARSDARGCVVLGGGDPVASAESDIRARFPRLASVRVRDDGHATDRELRLGIDIVRNLLARANVPCASVRS